MLDAAKIVGLNVLRLMTDVTAGVISAISRREPSVLLTPELGDSPRLFSQLYSAALSYGIYKTDMPPDKTTHVAFVDMGALDTTVSVVAFVKGRLTVLSTASDRHLGGRDFDRVIAEHFAAEWKEKHGIDARTNKKAWFRLGVAAEKCKKAPRDPPRDPSRYGPRLAVPAQRTTVAIARGSRSDLLQTYTVPRGRCSARTRSRRSRSSASWKTSMCAA